MKKVAELTTQLQAADKALNDVKAADANLNKQLATEKAERDKKEQEIQANQKKLADATNALKAIPEKLKQTQASLPKLEEESKPLVAATAEAKKKVDSLNAQIAANLRDQQFWKAQAFHMGVLTEKERLKELELELPESPDDEQTAALEYQKKKLASLHQQYLGLLPK